MRRVFVFIYLASLALQSVAYASNLVIKPTTTLAQQTSNNTSAADSFKTQVNGNTAAGNVSKLNIHSLLYSGNHTKVYAHFMGWFGTYSHMNVGYDSTSPTQVARQVQDMISRGIDGVIIDWYGKGTTSDYATLALMKEAEAHPGFTFAIMVDQGAIANHACSGCTPQQALAKHLQYIEQTYFGSPAYMRIQSRPVVTNFDIDANFQIDWKAAENAVASDPTFLFQSSPAFTHPMTGGGYSWVQPKTTDYGSSYLTNFYKTGKTYTNLQTVGASYKGFNDKLALWGANRIMDQQCGQTWLQTFSKINGMYSSSNQLDALQLVTWNDYEEGTEIESGIDNCVSVNASVAKNALNWSITGQESTIDHYRVYVSTDGKNLMSLADINTGNNSANLCSYSLASGNYQLFVQAVGKPNLRNQISAAVTYSPQCEISTPTPPPPVSTSNPPTSTPAPTPPAPAPTPTPVAISAAISIQAAPTSLKIKRGQFGNTAITVTSTSGKVAAPIAFSCSNLPVGMSCAFSPAVVTSSGNMTSMLTISTAPVTVAIEYRKHKQGFIYTSLFAFGMVSFVGIGQIKRRRVVQGLMALFVVSAAMLLSSCAGMSAGTGTSQIQSSANYIITVGGTAGGAQVTSATMSVSVE
jgi:hypothetical protein